MHLCYCIGLNYQDKMTAVPIKSPVKELYLFKVLKKYHLLNYILLSYSVMLPRIYVKFI